MLIYSCFDPNKRKYAFNTYTCRRWSKLDLKLQIVVNLSITEAKYMETTQARKEAMWIQKVTKELGQNKRRFICSMTVLSSLHIKKNPTFHSKLNMLESSFTLFKKWWEITWLMLWPSQSIRMNSNNVHPQVALQKYKPLGITRLKGRVFSI